MIDKIEIQLFNLCNRKCKFCPQYNMDMSGEFREMSDDEFEIILKKIISIKDRLNKTITVNLTRYCEPVIMIDKYLNYSKRMKNTLKELGIKSDVRMFSNTELMDENNFDKIFKNNIVDSYSLSVYNNNYDNYAIKKIRKESKIINVKPNKNVFNLAFNDKEVKIAFNKNDNIFVFNRGSVLFKNVKNTNNICNEMHESINIDCNGNMMLCCHTYNNINKDAIIGNIFTDDISFVLDSIKNINIQDIDSCKYCNACNIE